CGPGIETADEPDAPHSAAELLQDLDSAIGPEPEGTPWLELAAGMAHREPRAGGQSPHEQRLLRRSGLSVPMQSRGDHARDVEDEDVPRFHEVPHGAEMQMSNHARRAVQHEQAA